MILKKMKNGRKREDRRERRREEGKGRRKERTEGKGWGWCHMLVTLELRAINWRLAWA